MLVVSDKITAVPVDKERIERQACLLAYHPKIEARGSIHEAIDSSRINVICGSFYLMKEALEMIRGRGI